ncbi:ATP-binding protein, partial [bacterium]
QAIRFAFSEDYGRVLENIVYIELKRRKNDIYYFKEKKECDFLTAEKGKVMTALQVTKTFNQDGTRDREIGGLVEAMDYYGLKEGLILTEDESEELTIDERLIKIMPVWLWLLQ